MLCFSVQLFFGEGGDLLKEGGKQYLLYCVPPPSPPWNENPVVEEERNEWIICITHHVLTGDEPPLPTVGLIVKVILSEIEDKF